MDGAIGKGLRRTLMAVAVEMALCGMAYAQVQPEAPAAPVQDQSGAAQEPPPVVVVTGARAALARSLELKRNADVIQDSISATELGRFPDDNVADSLTHISGISVSRTRGGEGQYINVRGLGSGYNIVTLNKRILATDGDGRDFAFDLSLIHISEPTRPY